MIEQTVTSEEKIASLDPELKAKWVAALRSGIYVQGQDQLRIDTFEGPLYCCLGVLCEVAGAPYHPTDQFLDDYKTAELGLPQSVQDTLACLNDGSVSTDLRKSKFFQPDGPGDTHSFNRIADLIEAHL